MSSDESIEDRQENEWIALKSIYGSQLNDLRTKAVWNQWKPLNLQLALTPQQGTSAFIENYVKLDLHVICSNTYPDDVPSIELENSIGLSNIKIKELEQKLNKKAIDLRGEVMVHELAMVVEEFLSINNIAASKSCYEDMILRQKEEKRQEEEAEKKKIELQNQSLRNEIRERHEILNAEKRMKKRLSTDTSTDSDAHRRSTSTNRFNSSTEISDELICDHKKIDIIEFSNNGSRTIWRGQCLSHKEDNCVIYSGMDRQSGKLYLITEWKVQIKNTEESHLKQITSFEHELIHLMKLHHENITQYFNITHIVDKTTNLIHLYVLQEFIFGSNCKGLVKNAPIEMDLIRHIAEGVLNGLLFLHDNKVFHKDLNGSSVYLTDNGTIKLSSYSLIKRISDHASNIHSSEYNKKTDIYSFGMLILFLVKGIEDDNNDIPDNISAELRDFITKCFNDNERDRYSAIQLLNHKFIKHHILPSKIIQNKCDDVDDDVKIHELHSSIHSRFTREFEVFEHLGAGAYGSVDKVRNKLDRRFYALKKIELNPKNKQINKKIIREVTLLSQLNHENVVRYYNSWIETQVFVDEEMDCCNESVATENGNLISGFSNSLKSDFSVNSYTTEDDSSEDESSSEDDDDDGSHWMNDMVVDLESDDGIEFELGDGDSEQNSESNKAVKVVGCSTRKQFMYIQMEFCEKSTLRSAIDAELYKEKERVWRLFREIVEGLCYIHQQGMIHRDLKPMNIFLDSSDHVKIGDFGLATSSLLTKTNDAVINSKSYYEEGSHDGGDPSMTGHVGTALYVAPELTSTVKAIYNQKVDIYSLGVIFFEMTYKPMNTGMERISTITKLRLEETVFPEDFENNKNEHEILRWLLNQNPKKRPTSQELLQSDYIPPPVLEEFQLRELVKHTLSNTQLKGYKYLVESCFKQPVTRAQDITYDKDISAPNIILKNLLMYDYVKEIVSKVFKIHGGQQLSTPLLMPRSLYYDGIDSCVKLMTHSGSIVSIPHDLRVPFARYIAWNGITSLRRYSIERVYREKRVFGFIPRELYECAFDIVSSTPGNLLGDAEILSILQEIIKDIPGLEDKNLQIRLNHTQLLEAIFLNYGIKYADVSTILSETKDGGQIRMHLKKKGLDKNSIDTLLQILETEYDPLFKLDIFRRNREAAQCGKQALDELNTIIKHAQRMGVTFRFVISPGSVSNLHQYSGMMCQLVCEVKRKHKHVKDVIAAGGRYDSMINEYRGMMVQANMSNNLKQSAVGISISLDKLIQAIMNKEQDLKLNNLDVVICSLGSTVMLDEKLNILRELWLAGIKSTLIEANTLDDILEQCKELNVSNVIQLKDADHGYVKIVSLDREFVDKRIPLNDLVESMQKIINENINELNTSSNQLFRLESKMVNYEHHNIEVTVSIYCVNVGEKIAANTRKRQENLIRTQMDAIFKRLTGEVCVLAIPVDSVVINKMAYYLNMESEDKFNKSIQDLEESFRNSKHKKYLKDICDQIYTQKCRRNNSILILYSTTSNTHKVLL